MGATGYKILDLAISANTPDGNTWFEITQKVSGVNVSKRISAPTLAAYFAPDLSAYLTSATAAATYVPLTRNLTINGTTYNLSADRSWTIPTGGNETLAQTLALGNTSGANDIVMSTTQDIVFMDGDNIYYTVISNDQSQAGNRIVYLPTYTGQLAYHATGVPLTTNYVLKGTTNGAITSSSLIYDNGTNVGIGTSSPAYFVTIEKNVNDFPYHLVIANNSAGTSAASSLRINTDVNGMEFGVLNSGNTVYSTYGGANDAFLRYNPSVSYQGNVNFLLSPNASTTKAFRFFVSQNAGSNYRLAIDKDGVLIKGSTSDSTAYALKVDNSSSSKLVYARNDGTIELYDGGSISLGTTTGVKIGIGTTDKLGFWNTTPIVQPTTGITAATFAANTSAIADDTATFDGYTIGQVVKALRNVGLLA